MNRIVAAGFPNQPCIGSLGSALDRWEVPIRRCAQRQILKLKNYREK